MHRHCLRSALLQSSESTSANPLYYAQRLSFSSSSLSPAESKKRTRKEKVQFFQAADPRTVYYNKATSDTGINITKRDQSPGTPTRFISPKPLLANLLDKEQQSFIAGNGPEKVEADTLLSDDSQAVGTLVLPLNPGTFVEMRRNERSIEAIVVGNTLLDNTMQTVCLTSGGEIIYTLPNNIYFTIPNIVSVDLATRCGSGSLPALPHETNARVEVLKALRKLLIEAQQAAQGSRMWDRQNMLSVYDEIKHHDPKQWGSVTLEHVTNLFYVQPGYINYYATHKYLMDRPLKYVADAGYLQNQIFRVRPERDVQEIQTVEHWISKYRFKSNAIGPYKSFITKARGVVAKYKANPPRDRGAMVQEKWDTPWSEDDKVILSYLIRSQQKWVSSQLDPYRVGRSTLVKDILKVSDVSDHTIHQLLIQLGVLAPWQDLHVLNPPVNTTGDITIHPSTDEESTKIFKSSSHPQPVSGLVLGPLDFVPRDPLHSVRHDFGNLRAFVVDDPTAQELDDAISVERIPTEPENTWIHVHIADPARHLHPGHALSHRARNKLTSLYLISTNLPMFPNAFMHNPKFNNSLIDTSTSNEPNYVLTFSVKVDDKANVLDYKIRAGVLRNVRKATYGLVDSLLGAPQTSSDDEYPLGKPNIKQPQLGTPFSDSDAADLRLLYKLASDQVNRRLEKKIVNREDMKSFVEMLAEPSPEMLSPSLSGSVFHGFPEMSYRVINSKNESKYARSLVAEMMVLACRSASRFALDHNLPFIRRVAQPTVWEDPEAVWKTTNNSGWMSAQLYYRWGGMAPPASNTQEAGSHFHLGLPAGEGYSRVTSPLRRFLDLVMHWQIHHALLGSNAPARPPFSSYDIDTLITEAGVKEVQYRRLGKANQYFYALMCIQRFAEDTANGAERPMGDPLARLEAFTMKKPALDNTNINSLTVPVTIPKLGIHASLVNLSPNAMDMLPGTDVVVKIKKVELGLRAPKLHVTLAS